MRKNLSSFPFWIASLVFMVWIIIVLSLAFQSFEEQDLRPAIKQRVSEETLQRFLPKWEFSYAGSWQTYREPYRMAHFFLRKGAHLFVYSFLAFFLVYQQLLAGAGAVNAFSKTLLIVFLVAATDEGIQYLNDGRTGLLEDVVLDIFASVFALLWLAWRARVGLDFHRDII